MANVIAWSEGEAFSSSSEQLGMLCGEPDQNADEIADSV